MFLSDSLSPPFVRLRYDLLLLTPLSPLLVLLILPVPAVPTFPVQYASPPAVPLSPRQYTLPGARENADNILSRPWYALITLIPYLLGFAVPPQDLNVEHFPGGS